MGAVTFSVITTVFTGGTGCASSGAGKAALAAKAQSAAGEAGPFLDPMTCVFNPPRRDRPWRRRGPAPRGHGTPRRLPPRPEGALKLPEGTTVVPERALKGVDQHGNTVHLDGPGNILKEDGSLPQRRRSSQPPALTPLPPRTRPSSRP
ncbi:hypothetical protein [Streptomyces sp. DT9]